MFLPHCSRMRKRQIVSCQKRHGRNSFLSLEDPACTRNAARRIWPNGKSERYDFSFLFFFFFFLAFFFSSAGRRVSNRKGRQSRRLLSAAARLGLAHFRPKNETSRTQKLVRGSRLITGKEDLRGRVRDYTAETLSRPLEKPNCPRFTWRLDAVREEHFLLYAGRRVARCLIARDIAYSERIIIRIIDAGSRTRVSFNNWSLP